jgi:cell division septation protein DedD
LQASSFPNEPEANAFSTALRQRGHHAYVELAEIPGRGTWYRVRIGPFKSRVEAAAYRSDFEKREHIVPFLVEPNSTTDAARPKRDANAHSDSPSRSR